MNFFILPNVQGHWHDYGLCPNQNYSSVLLLCGKLQRSQEPQIKNTVYFNYKSSFANIPLHIASIGPPLPHNNQQLPNNTKGLA
eukprot:8627135-Ditylum_brightwellii.AAC.1